MRYIKNSELREWVKESLRKAIFQKAHSLAIQTGCEVLIKLDDVVDTAECQYYATDVLQKAYDNNQLKKSPSEVQVSGETGLPLTKTVKTRLPGTSADMIDRASQSAGSMCIDDEDDESVSIDKHAGSQKASYLEEQLPGGSRSSKLSNLGNVTQQVQALDGPVEDMEHEDSGDEDDDDEDDDDEMYRDEIRQVVYDDPKSMRDHLSETSTCISDEVVKNESSCVVERSVESEQSTPNQSVLKVDPNDKNKEILPASEKSTSSLEVSSANSAASVSVSEPKTAAASQSLGMSPSIRPYQCGVCQKTFGSIQVLSRHAQTFHGMNRGMRYYCNICGQSYKLAQYLQAHVKMHDTVTVAPVLCKICGMGYYSNAALKQHELTHSTAAMQEVKSSSAALPCEPAHTVSSHPVDQEDNLQVQSKPNPRLQLSQSSSLQGSKLAPTTSNSLKTNRPAPQSPSEAKRFKPDSSEEKDETKQDSFHEPKQFHCLVCGMAFEEGEQLEEHVLKKHMQQDESQLLTTSSPIKDAEALPPEETDSSDTCQPQGTSNQGESQIKEEATTPPPSTLQSFDKPGTSEGSSMLCGPNATTFPPFSALDNAAFCFPPHSQSLHFPHPPGSLLNPNANITSVLEQALPGLLPGVSLLSNPTQLPMAQAAASIAQSEGHPPMVSQDGRFTCDICGNSYKYNCTLKEHRLTHAQTPLFSCKICNQAFSRQRQLRDHMFRHSGAYPYHCKLCGKGFVRPSILRRHETDRHKQAWENVS